MIDNYLSHWPHTDKPNYDPNQKPCEYCRMILPIDDINEDGLCHTCEEKINEINT